MVVQTFLEHEFKKYYMYLMNRIKTYLLSVFENTSAKVKIHMKTKKVMLTLRKEVVYVWGDREKDIEMNLKYEVLTGLLMYQYHLTHFVIYTKKSWSPEIAGFFIRSMTEVLINLRWLIENGTDDDFKSFRDYGLGKEAQFTNRVQRMKEDIEEKGGIFPNHFEETLGDSIRNTESQQYMNITNVSLSNWRPQNTSLRGRAEQIDKECLEMYNAFFERQSSLVHGQWNSLSEYFLRRCENPLHNLHFIPKFDRIQPTVHMLGIIISLMVRSFNFWAKYLKNDHQTQIEKIFFGKNITPTNIGGSKNIK